jgi:hypothetical protein
VLLPAESRETLNASREHTRTCYDRREAEVKLSALPQFMTEIDAAFAPLRQVQRPNIGSRRVMPPTTLPTTHGGRP